ncbi:MAG TPA: hypothetical protein VE132_07555, partial [Micromonosporaceae bacterium]|nr:hypothetical protein [Micromonosporaceae bacterium]
MRVGVRLAAGIVVVLAAGMVTACSSKPKTPEASAAVETFLHGWTSHTFDPSVQFVDPKGE